MSTDKIPAALILPIGIQEETQAVLDRLPVETPIILSWEFCPVNFTQYQPTHLGLVAEFTPEVYGQLQEFAASRSGVILDNRMRSLDDVSEIYSIVAEHGLQVMNSIRI